MIFILETLDTYGDTWKMTFYFVFAIAILIGLLWTILKMDKDKEQKANKTKENTIYNKPYDAIENIDVLPKRKFEEKTDLENHYDVYQNETKNKYLNAQEDNQVKVEPTNEYEKEEKETTTQIPKEIVNESRVEGTVEFTDNDDSINDEESINIIDKNTVEFKYEINDKETNNKEYYNYNVKTESSGKNIVKSNNKSNKKNKNKNKHHKNNKKKK